MSSNITLGFRSSGMRHYITGWQSQSDTFQYSWILNYTTARFSHLTSLSIYFSYKTLSRKLKFKVLCVFLHLSRISKSFTEIVWHQIKHALITDVKLAAIQKEVHNPLNLMSLHYSCVIYATAMYCT